MEREKVEKWIRKWEEGKKPDLGDLTQDEVEEIIMYSFYRKMKETKGKLKKKDLDYFLDYAERIVVEVEG